MRPLSGQTQRRGSPAPGPASAPVRSQIAAAAVTHFVTSFPAGVRSKPATGRVLLFLGRPGAGEPRQGGGFFKPFPVYAIDVTNVTPNQEVIFSPERFREPDALAFPQPLDQLPEGPYDAQLQRRSRKPL